MTVKLYTDQKAMSAAVNTPNETYLGVYTPDVARVLKAGALSLPNTVNETEVTEFGEYITALHEVMHGLASKSFNPDYLQRLDKRGGDRATWEGITRPPRNLGKNPATGRVENIPSMSFEETIAAILLNHPKIPKDALKAIKKELRDMQNKASFVVDGESERVRPEGSMRDTNYRKYARAVPEVAVDPLIFYMHDPKRMKKEFPNTAAVIKAFFSQSSKVQFFSHPLAMGFAVVLAMMMKQEQADEEDMQRGILAQQQAMQAGALTA